MTELVIAGNIPSKKNMLKVTASGHGYYDKELRQQLNDLSEQVARQWSKYNVDGVKVPREPLVHPAIALVFYVVSDRSDKDNKTTTLMDALVSGGALKDDCIAYCNGPILICEAVKTPVSAGVRIFIEESGDFERLWRRVRAVDLKDYTWLKDLKAARQGKRRFQKV